MPAGAEHDRDAALVQEIIRAQHVVAGLDLMVDVLDAGPWRPYQRNGVMDRIDAHQRNIADAVADAARCRPRSRTARRAQDRSN